MQRETELQIDGDDEAIVEDDWFDTEVEEGKRTFEIKAKCWSHGA